MRPQRFSPRVFVLSLIVAATSLSAGISKPGTVVRLLEECDDVLPTNICEALWVIYGELSYNSDGDCNWAAQELWERLQNPAEGLAYYSGENYSAYMVYDSTAGVYEYKMRLGNDFMNKYNSGLGGQLVAHELVGHYHYDYTDDEMVPQNWGSQCNFN